eukprot:4578630-Ditylum_brightwellii.AAC.1
MPNPTVSPAKMPPASNTLHASSQGHNKNAHNAEECIPLALPPSLSYICVDFHLSLEEGRKKITG